MTEIITAQQRQAIDRILCVMRSDGWHDARLVVRNAREELLEFAPDPSVADRVLADAIIVHRDPDVDWRCDRPVEYFVPDDGLILDGAGHVIVDLD